MNLNKVLIVGNLTRDPEVRVVAGGKSVAKFCVALNHRWKNAAGEKQEETTFMECEAWGHSAEFAQQYFHKGDQMLVEGELRQQNWTDKESGQKRSKVFVSVQSVGFVGSKKDREPRDSDRDPPQARPAAPAPAAPADSMQQDDLPF